MLKKVGIILILFWGCVEIPPELSTSGPSNEKVSRKVLLEEFTGVRCVNCPAAHDLIKELLEQHGDQIIPVSIHAGFFSTPPNKENKFDLHLEKGEQIFDAFGTPIGYPSGLINREEEKYFSPSEWPARIQEQVKLGAQVDLGLDLKYDEDNSQLEITVTIENISANLASNGNMIIYISESGIVDAQITPSGLEEAYEHNYVVREIVTNVLGDPVTASLIPGEEISITYFSSVSQDWNIQNLSVVAAFTNSENLILQAVEQTVFP